MVNNSAMANKQALLSISGHVQGVFYRAHAQEKAVQLGLTGYVKNMSDNSVEALVQGSEEKIKSFIKWCQEGSPSSKVEQIKTTWQPQGKHFETFDTY